MSIVEAMKIQLVLQRLLAGAGADNEHREAAARGAACDLAAASEARLLGPDVVACAVEPIGPAKVRELWEAWG